jgi:hypothetical protein
VAQAIAVLRAYLQHHTGPQVPEQAVSRIEHRPADRHSSIAQTNGSQMNGTQANGTRTNGSGNGGSRMSTQEAFDVLGLKPTPSPREVKAAHRHLAQLLDYLLAKIDEARDVLLGE